MSIVSSSSKNIFNFNCVQDKRILFIRLRNPFQYINSSFINRTHDTRICHNFIHTPKNPSIMIMPGVKSNPSNPSSSIPSWRRAQRDSRTEAYLGSSCRKSRAYQSGSRGRKTASIVFHVSIKDSPQPNIPIWQARRFVLFIFYLKKMLVIRSKKVKFLLDFKLS